MTRQYQVGSEFINEAYDNDLQLGDYFLNSAVDDSIPGTVVFGGGFSRSINYNSPINKQSPLSRGLAAAYINEPQLRGGSRWIDLAGNNHGALTNGPTWSSLSPSGRNGSLSFTSASSQYVNLGTSITNGDYLYAAAWAYPTASGAYGYIISRDGATQRQWIFGHNSASNWYGVVWNTSGTLVEIGGGAIPALNRWYHVAIRYNGANAVFFIDGVKQTAGTLAGTLRTGGQQVDIGRQGNNTSYWQGNIADPIIINRLLSDNDCVAIYNEARLGYPTLLNRTTSYPKAATTTATSIYRTVTGATTFAGACRTPICVDHGTPINRSSPLSKGVVAAYINLPGGSKGARFLDLTGKYHGSLTNGPTWNAQYPPNGNGSLIFNDAGDIRVSGFPFITPPLTLSCWFKVPASVLAEQANYFSLITRGSIFENNTNYALAVRSTPTRIACYWRNGSTLYGNESDTGISLLANTWNQVHAVIESNYDLNVYWNGKLAWTDTGNAVPTDGSQALMFGSPTTVAGTDDRLIGNMDRIFIRNKAMTAGEIAQDYNESRLGYPTLLSRFGREASNTSVATTFAGACRTPICIDHGTPINRSSPLSKGLVAAYISLPGQSKGLKLWDLVGKNHGTLTNGPTWSALSPPGGLGSLLFDGTDDFVSVNPPPSTTTFTLSAWVYQTANSSFRSVYGSSSRFFNVRDGIPQFWDGTDHVSTATLSLNRWYHIIWTYDGTTLYFYVDGQPAGTYVGSVTLPSSSVVIGGWGGASLVWAGMLNGILFSTSFQSDGNALYSESRLGYPTLLSRFGRGVAFATSSGEITLNIDGVCQLEFTLNMYSDGANNLEYLGDLSQTSEENLEFLGGVQLDSIENIESLLEILSNGGINQEWHLNLNIDKEVNYEFLLSLMENATINKEWLLSVNGDGTANIEFTGEGGSLSVDFIIPLEFIGDVLESGGINLEFLSGILQSGGVNIEFLLGLLQDSATNNEWTLSVNSDGQINLELKQGINIDGGTGLEYVGEVSFLNSANFEFLTSLIGEALLHEEWILNIDGTHTFNIEFMGTTIAVTADFEIPLEFLLGVLSNNNALLEYQGGFSLDGVLNIESTLNFGVSHQTALEYLISVGKSEVASLEFLGGFGSSAIIPIEFLEDEVELTDTKPLRWVLNSRGTLWVFDARAKVWKPLSRRKNWTY